MTYIICTVSIIVGIFALAGIFILVDFIIDRRFNRILNTHEELKKAYFVYTAKFNEYTKYINDYIRPIEQEITALAREFYEEVGAEKEQIRKQIRQLRDKVVKLKAKNEFLNAYKEYEKVFWAEVDKLNACEQRFIRKYFNSIL